MPTRDPPDTSSRSSSYPSHSMGTAPNPPVTGGISRSRSSGGSGPSRASLLRSGSASHQFPPQLVRQSSQSRPIPAPVEITGDVSLIDDGDEELEYAIESGEISFDSVVKVFATIQEPDFGNPWQSQGIESATGSGVAIDTEAGRRILTAAHVVADQTFLQLQRIGVQSPDKYVASVYAVWHECDLALLDVESEAFWKDLKPAKLGPIPSHRSVVLVAGFPVGGEELSITEGVVSRIEGQSYSHSHRRLLAVQVDAAINPGNSGGPAFNAKGELIGIAFQALEGAMGTGHIVPPPVIEHFLEGVRKFGPKGYKGFPSAGIEYQELTNPYLRQHLKLDEDVYGVLVTYVSYGNTCHGVLKKGDVLTCVADQAVANNGTIAFGRYGRVELRITFTMFQCGTTINLGIVRDGKPTTVQVTTRPPIRLVPLSQHDRNPPYFIYCGLVFQPLSLDYIDSQVGIGTNPYFFHLFFMGRHSKDQMQVVVLSKTLSDKVNVGYEALTNEPIERVNGEKIKDLQDLVQKVEQTTGPMVRFETMSDGCMMVPSPTNPEAVDANNRILSRYRVVSDRCID